MVDRKKYPQLASLVLKNIHIGMGDAVYISGSTHHQAFLEEIGVQVARCGGQPHISANSDRYYRRLMEAQTVEQLKRTPKMYEALARATDAMVFLESPGDPRVKRGFQEKMQARSEGMHPIMEIIYGKPGKKWLYMGWPSEGMAQMYGIPLAELERLIIDGSLIDYAQLQADCQHVIRLLQGAKRVHATDPYGTDFWLDVGGRRLNPDDGILTPEREAVGDIGGNLPAGEVFVAPVETKGEGTLFCPLTIDDLTRSHILRDVKIRFRDGMLIPEECTAREGQDILRDNLKKYVEIDNLQYGGPNALKVAELGIGLNPVIDRAIGYILTDEKIGGSVHVAFGRSDMYGGNVASSMHWDFVTAPWITLEVEHADGSRKLLMKDGKLLR